MQSKRTALAYRGDVSGALLLWGALAVVLSPGLHLCAHEHPHHEHHGHHGHHEHGEDHDDCALCGQIQHQAALVFESVPVLAPPTAPLVDASAPVHALAGRCLAPRGRAPPTTT